MTDTPDETVQRALRAVRQAGREVELLHALLAQVYSNPVDVGADRLTGLDLTTRRMLFDRVAWSLLKHNLEGDSPGSLGRRILEVARQVAPGLEHGGELRSRRGPAPRAPRFYCRARGCRERALPPERQTCAAHVPAPVTTAYPCDFVGCEVPSINGSGFCAEHQSEAVETIERVGNCVRCGADLRRMWSADRTVSSLWRCAPLDGGHCPEEPHVHETADGRTD